MNAALRRGWTALVPILTIFSIPATSQSAGPSVAASAPRVPYTAEFKITRIQTLANGTTITRETQEVMARDAQGRNMRAVTVLTPADQPGTNVNVNDPANGQQITWNTQTQRAHVLKTPVGDRQHGCWSTPSGNATSQFGAGQSMTARTSPPPPSSGNPGPSPMLRVQPVREDLGTDTIMGVEVQGTRSTRTIPAGQIGNDQPLVRTSESWRAPSLGIVLRQTTDDPQTGKTTRELISLDLADPSPAKFQPPAGYAVDTEQMRQVACPAAP